MRRGWNAAPIACFVLTGCAADVYVCSRDAECGDGVCEADGYCAFEDADCESGRRYGRFAGDGQAGVCVPPGGATGTSGGSDSATSTSGSGTTGPTSGSTTTLDPTAASSTGDDPVGSTGGPDPVEFTDDEWDGEFAAGTIDGLEWTDAAVRLDANSKVGPLESRVFDAERDVEWTHLRWHPLAPYGRPLPGEGGTERYDSANADMTDNVLLYLFDEAETGATIVDASPEGNDGTVIGPGFSSVSGRFAGALSHDGGTYVDVPLNPSIVPGSDDFTWAFWWRSESDACDGDGATLMTFDSSSNEAAAPAVWIACTKTSGAAPCSGDGALWLNVGRRHDGPAARVCGSAAIDDGRWHHVALVKTGVGSVTVRGYVDGQPDGSDSASLGGPIEVAGEVRMTIGGQAQFTGLGEFDEVAIWRRALSEDEIRDLYYRGARRLSFRVRACSDPTCSDAAFEGPGGIDTAFTDVEGSEVGLASLPGRYFQYAAELERDAGAPSPAVDRVTVGGE